MPVIDGEKWACSSCIKGHRVSGCNHNDRELHHINPKGRPVKQCEHCRGARKSKSHHAKCDCGEKKDKPKDKADIKGTPSAGHASRATSHPLPVLDGSCQCHMGAKCICGGKDSLDLKVDTRPSLHEACAKPKLMTNHSEPHLTVFANGHHKPCHRNNNSAHVSGAPYRIPRPHTLHGHSAFAALAQSNNRCASPDAPTTRSMDTLSLSNTDFYAMFGSAPRSAVESLPTPMTATMDTMGYQEALFTDNSSMYRSEPPSSSHGEPYPSQQWQWPSAAATPVTSTFGYNNFSASPSQERLPAPESDWAMAAANFNPLWSAGDLPLDPSKFNDSLAQPTSHSGESKQSGPGLTAASSVHSEIGETSMAFGELDFRTPQSTASDSLFWDDSPVPVPRLNTSAPSENLMTPALPAMPSIPNVQMMQPAFQKSLAALPSSTSSPIFPESPMTMSGGFEDVMAVDAWAMDQNTPAFTNMNNFEMPYQGNWF